MRVWCHVFCSHVLFRLLSNDLAVSHHGLAKAFFRCRAKNPDFDLILRVSPHEAFIFSANLIIKLFCPAVLNVFWRRKGTRTWETTKKLSLWRFSITFGQNKKDRYQLAHFYISQSMWKGQPSAAIFRVQNFQRDTIFAYPSVLLITWFVEKPHQRIFLIKRANSLLAWYTPKSIFKWAGSSVRKYKLSRISWELI